MVKYRDGEKMLDALGLPLRRNMVRRLRLGGAMSLSKLATPYKLTLPAALKHLRILENSGIVKSHKHGRIRVCVYNPSALKELGGWLASQSAFWDSSLDRLEGFMSKKKK